MKLGILVAGSPRTEDLGIAGNYPAMFRRLLLDVDPTLSFASFDVRADQWPAPGACDAFIITGSPHGAYDSLPWIARLGAFLRELHRWQRKLVGVCFGHQMIAQALGGEVRQAPQGWGVGITPFEVVAHKPWMQPPLACVRLPHSHQDQVLRLPVGAELLGRSTHCPHELYTVGEEILCVQGHPEYTRPYLKALMAPRRELIGAERHDAALASLGGPDDGATLARWMLAFISPPASPGP